MKNVSITNAWTGLNNIGANNLQWSDGTPYTFESFRKGEPNGDHEHCVAFEGNRWNDARCAASYYYVCKKRGEWIHRWGGGGGGIQQSLYVEALPVKKMQPSHIPYTENGWYPFTCPQ